MLKINFLGDSITEGYLASDIDKSYVNVVARLLDCKTNNYGIAGTRIAQSIIPSENSRYDDYFGGRVKDMDHTADYVFVFGGTNDYGHGTAPFGELGNKTPRTFYGGMDYLINELLKYYRKEQIIFILPLYRFNENSRYGDGRKRVPDHTLEEYRQAMVEVINQYGIEIFDIKDRLGKAEDSKYLEDGLHPNDLGHELIGQLIAEHIKQKL